MPNVKSLYSFLSCRSQQSVATVEDNTSPPNNTTTTNSNNNSNNTDHTTLKEGVDSLDFPVIQVTTYLDMSNSRDFNDKVVLVTGSSSGIGAATAKYFARCGAQVVVNGRNAKAINDVAAECASLSPNKYKALQIQADVNKDEDCRRIMETTINHYGRLDILVNNAGAGLFSSIHDPKLMGILDQMFALNVRSVVLLTQLAVPHLEKTKGVIVNISSTLALKPNAQFMPYCVAKAAIEMFTKCISLELGPKGVRVNCVNPTAVSTNFQERMGADDMINGVIKYLKDAIPMRRIATVEDVTNAIGYLASSDASFVNGTSLVVDGGSLNM